MYSRDDSANVETPCYLPRTLISNWIASPRQTPVWSEWLTGSLMHCDVTGFTAMNEKLSKLGREGGEIMADILNEFFDRMLGIAEKWDGIHLKYGGDAMLLLFSGNEHAPRAARAGLDMQQAMADFTGLNVINEIYDLRMRIGIHSGRFFSASVGEPDGLLHYLITGADVNRTAQVEPMAEPDQVVVSQATADLLGNSCELETTQHDQVYLLRTAGTPRVKHSLIDYNKAPRDILRRYLMPPIAAGKVRTKDRDHRRVSIVFISLKGLTDVLRKQGDERALQQMDAYIKLLFAVANKYGGYLSQSDVSETGDTLVVLFGAPISHGEHEQNACHFAYELNNEFNRSGLQLKHQIGINTGYVFAGETGSTRRRDYTTTGDNMNLAARLMGAAGPGNILISANTAERLTTDYSLRKLDAIKVKGKNELIDIFRLEQIADELQPEKMEKQVSFVGRIAELEQLGKLAEKAELNQVLWSYIHGSAGIGKSRLCREFASKLKRRNWVVLTGICQFYDSSNAFSAWKYPLRRLFGINSSDTDAQVWNKVFLSFDEVYPEGKVFAPLIADILAIQEQTNSVANSLDLKTRREKLLHTVKQLFANYSLRHNSCIFFDNVQWIDSSSVELIRHVIGTQGARICVCLLSQSDQAPPLLSGKQPDLALSLEELSPEECRQFVDSYSEISPQDREAIIQKADGNPYFLGELAANVVAKGELVLPDTINDVITMRMDKLDNASREIIRRASVIGHGFELKTLQSIFKSTPVD